MKFHILPGTLVFEGVLDETCVLDDFLKVFEDFKSQGHNGEVKVDLSKVKRANSTGIVVWLKFLQSIKTPVCYMNCPVWLVNQFNMIDQFFHNNSKVGSIQTPFYCEETGACRVVTLNLGEEVPILESYENYTFENRTIDGKVYEPDFDPEGYLSFISLISSQYAAA